MRNLPNLISLFRLLLSPYVPVLASRGNETGATVLFLLLALSDALDGAVARLFRYETSLGKFLDPIADKVLLFMGLVSITFYTQLRANPILLELLVFRDLFLIAGSLFLKRFGFIPEPTLLGKLTTFFVSLTVFCGLLLNLYRLEILLNLFSLLEALSLALIVVSAVDYGVRGVNFLLSKLIIEKR
ncbi:CDP-alcohol phosphatidyltransferase family protein [Hydrogenivirga sp.]